MSETQPVPSEILDAEVAHLCREIASVWLTAMSMRRVDFEFLAERTGESASRLSSIVHELVDGQCTQFSFKLFSFVMTALDMRIRVDFVPMRQAPRQFEEAEQSGADTATAEQTPPA